MIRAAGESAPDSPAEDARLRTAESVLLAAEREIRLLDRLAPENAPAERERLRVAVARGELAEPRLRYARPADFSELRRSLERLARSLSPAGPLAAAYAERALELELEAALVEALGSPAFTALSARRFDPDALWDFTQVSALVDSWLAEDPEAPEERIATDDASHPDSLVSVLRREIGARRLPVRVELNPALAAVAAAGENAVVVRPSVLLTGKHARRIAEHELVAHVLPRLAARSEVIGLFRAGFRGAGEQEEGRALCLEERGGFLDGSRRRELALRHVGAAAIRGGASFAEAVARLSAAGAPVERSVDVVLRAARGGGLGRELVYLPAYLAVRAAFAAEPELERCFRRGRVSIDGARLVARLEAGSAPA